MKRTVTLFALAIVGLTMLGLPLRAVGADKCEAGFKSIFDGKTLDGWDGDPKLWRVEDGTITGQTTADTKLKVNNFIIWRQGKLDDFELRFEYRMDGGNSGVQYRSWEEPEKWGKWVVGGYQADMDAGNTYTGILYGERYRGILAKRGEKTVIGSDHKPKVVGSLGDTKQLGSFVKPGEWNQYRITARGFHFIHEINGHVMVEVTDEDTAMRRRSGILAFQIHQGPPMKVQFRNIRLKRLKMEDEKKIVLIAGPKSHGYGAHEHNAGCLLLAKDLNQNVPGVHAVVYRNGWPKDPTALDNADAIVIFADGGGRHPAMKHLKELDKLMKQGVGLACLHYGVEIPNGEPGDYLKNWIGGYFETDWSVNPHWMGQFKSMPTHPITRGVKPFDIDDEWYCHMRFIDDMKGVTPILTAIPPDVTRQRKDGPHSNNPTYRSRSGQPEHVAWACERADGGRGFGFTGGHWHWSWANDNFRTLVLNSIAWVAGLDIPAGGVPSKTPTWEELEANQDFPQPKNFDKAKWQKLIKEWQK